MAWALPLLLLLLATVQGCERPCVHGTCRQAAHAVRLSGDTVGSTDWERALGVQVLSDVWYCACDTGWTGHTCNTTCNCAGRHVSPPDAGEACGATYHVQAPGDTRSVRDWVTEEAMKWAAPGMCACPWPWFGPHCELESDTRHLVPTGLSGTLWDKDHARGTSLCGPHGRYSRGGCTCVGDWTAVHPVDDNWAYGQLPVCSLLVVPDLFASRTVSDCRKQKQVSLHECLQRLPANATLVMDETRGEKKDGESSLEPFLQSTWLVILIATLVVLFVLMAVSWWLNDTKSGRACMKRTKRTANVVLTPG